MMMMMMMMMMMKEGKGKNVIVGVYKSCFFYTSTNILSSKVSIPSLRSFSL